MIFELPRNSWQIMPGERTETLRKDSKISVANPPNYPWPLHNAQKDQIIDVRPGCIHLLQHFNEGVKKGVCIVPGQFVDRLHPGQLCPSGDQNRLFSTRTRGHIEDHRCHKHSATNDILKRNIDRHQVHAARQGKHDQGPDDGAGNFTDPACG